MVFRFCAVILMLLLLVIIKALEFFHVDLSGWKSISLSCSYVFRRVRKIAKSDY